MLRLLPIVVSCSQLDVRTESDLPTLCHPNLCLPLSQADGQVYVWDMSSHECVHRFVDDGCTTGLSLAVSPDGTRFACGADSGVVNIYDEECLSKERPKPLKALMNLTTAADLLCFNSTR